MSEPPVATGPRVRKARSGVKLKLKWLENRRAKIKAGWYVIRAGKTALRPEEQQWATACFQGRLPKDVLAAALLCLVKVGDTHVNCACQRCDTPWKSQAPGSRQIHFDEILPFDEPIPCAQGNTVPIPVPQHLRFKVGQAAKRAGWRPAASDDTPSRGASTNGDAASPLLTPDKDSWIEG